MKNKFAFKTLVCITALSSILWYPRLTCAEGKKLLLFARNATFLPNIESILRDLCDYETNEPIFSNITNVNKWSINRIELGHLDSLVRFYESRPELRKKSRSAWEADSVFRELIKQADSYIRIDVLPKVALLEFQIIITDSLPGASKGEYPIIVTHESRYEGFVIDISREDFEYQLQKSLKRLFPKSNRAPIRRVQLNKQREEDGYYYFGLGHTAILDAAESYDLDTPPENLQFRWLQINPYSEVAPLPDSEIVPLDISSKRQVVSFSNKGEYHFALSVNDGIVDSEGEIIKIKVIDPPYIVADSHYFEKSRGWLSDRKFRVPFSVILDSPGGAQPRVASASVQARPTLWRKVFYKPQSATLDSGKYEVDCVFAGDSSEARVNYCQLLVEEGGKGEDYQYQFRIIAENEKCVADTVDIKVDFQNRDMCFRSDVVSFHFGSIKDSSGTDKRLVALRPCVRAYLSEQFSLDFGHVWPIFEEDIPDSLDIFDTPEVYLSLAYRGFSMPMYFGPDPGIGLGMDFTGAWVLSPFSVGFVYYGDYLSLNVSAGFDSSFDWATPIGVGGILFGWLSL